MDIGSLYCSFMSDWRAILFIVGISLCLFFYGRFAHFAFFRMTTKERNEVISLFRAKNELVRSRRRLLRKWSFWGFPGIVLVMMCLSYSDICR